MMNLEQLIEYDKQNKSSDPFTNMVLLKVHRKTKERLFFKKHLWVSLAAGVVLGLAISGFYKLRQPTERQIQLQQWMKAHCMDDMEMENLGQNYCFMKLN